MILSLDTPHPYLLPTDLGENYCHSQYMSLLECRLLIQTYRQLLLDLLIRQSLGDPCTTVWSESHTDWSRQTDRRTSHQTLRLNLPPSIVDGRPGGVGDTADSISPCGSLDNTWPLDTRHILATIIWLRSGHVWDFCLILILWQHLLRRRVTVLCLIFYCTYSISLHMTSNILYQISPVRESFIRMTEITIRMLSARDTRPSHRLFWHTMHWKL